MKFWFTRSRRSDRENLAEQYRRDVAALKRHRPVRRRGNDEIWSAGSDSSHSRSRKAAAWTAIGTVGVGACGAGCGGGCGAGCGGCGGCGG